MIKSVCPFILWTHAFYDPLPLKALETFLLSAFKIQDCSLKTPSKPVL